jgi:two-component system sensor kinase FixL
MAPAGGLEPPSLSFVSAILDTVDAAIYVLDRRGRIVSVNAGFEAVSGYARDEVAGKTMLETVVAKESAEAFGAYLAGALAGETSERTEGYWQRKDGSRCWIEASGRALRDRRGEVEWIVGGAIDRTRWRAAQEELRAERNFIASVLETSAALVVVVDSDGRIVRLNKAFAAATGEDPEGLESKPLRSLLPDEERESLEHAFAEVRSGRAAFCQHDSHLVRRDGSRREIAWASTGLRNDAGQMQFFVVTGIDVTERQRAADELRDRVAELAELHRRHMAGSLALAVAHELKQPLTAIASYSEGSLKRLRHGNSSAQDLIHDLEQIEVQAHHAAFVIRELRGFLGNVAVDTKIEDLDAVVASACALFTGAAHQHGVRIRLEPAGTLAPVLADRARTEHVLVNLLQNAVEAIASTGTQTGEIIVQTGVDPAGAARVTVRDTGPGVREQDVDRIFGRFYTTRVQGIGLGLPLSRALVEEQGGRLWAEPSAHGAIFHFTLPFAP